jgi:hypothetical protein
MGNGITSADIEGQSFLVWKLLLPKVIQREGTLHFLLIWRHHDFWIGSGETGQRKATSPKRDDITLQHVNLGEFRQNNHLF